MEKKCAICGNHRQAKLSKDTCVVFKSAVMLSGESKVMMWLNRPEAENECQAYKPGTSSAVKESAVERAKGDVVRTKWGWDATVLDVKYTGRDPLYVVKSPMGALIYLAEGDFKESVMEKKAEVLLDGVTLGPGSKVTNINGAWWGRVVTVQELRGKVPAIHVMDEGGKVEKYALNDFMGDFEAGWTNEDANGAENMGALDEKKWAPALKQQKKVNLPKESAMEKKAGELDENSPWTAIAREIEEASIRGDEDAVSAAVAKGDQLAAMSSPDVKADWQNAAGYLMEGGEGLDEFLGKMNNLTNRKVAGFMEKKAEEKFGGLTAIGGKVAVDGCMVDESLLKDADFKEEGATLFDEPQDCGPSDKMADLPKTNPIKE